MSLRNRLLAAVVAVLVAGLLAADITVFLSMRSFLVRRLDQQLVGASSSVASAVTQPGVSNSVDLDQLEGVVPGVFVQIRDATGDVLATSIGRGHFDSQTIPLLGQTLPPSGSFFNVAASDASHYRVHVAQLNPDGDVLIVGQPLTDTTATLHRIEGVEASVSLIVIIGAGAIGLWLVGIGLRPLDDIRQTARTIAEGDLTQRVTRQDSQTEVGQLGQSLNLMLGHIESAFLQRTESEERMRRFVADASHELRTPLSAVRAYAELFDRGAADNPEDLARSMRGIANQAERMSLLIDDLLLLTRLDQGRALEHKPVDLQRLVEDAVEDARVIAPERDIATNYSATAFVQGDYARLRQVVDNILANTRAHTPSDATVTVGLAKNGDRAAITIADTGPGISEEQQSHIFERFYRADSARTRDSGGSGLGLAIVDAIVRSHGGSVTVDSHLDEGSTFRIELPIVDY